MTNFDIIKNMDVDDYAVMITNLIHGRDLQIQRMLEEEHGIKISLIGLAPDIQAAIHKAWLEREADFDDL